MLDLLPAGGYESILSRVLPQKVTVEIIAQIKDWHKCHKSLILVEPFICFGDLGKWLTCLAVPGRRQ